MAGSPTGLIHVFLLCQFTASATSGAMKELVGAIGGSVTFPLTFTEKQIDSIVWSFNRTTLITIQPGTESKNATVIVTSNRNRERVDFSGGGYSLKLNKLRKNDSGSYSVQIHSSSSQFPSTQEYMLHVYENCPNGRSSKYALFHCADSKKDGESQLTTNNARHTKTVYL
ncbi:SLAM family member 7 isoform X5 [Carlito syrichta]|uniref:SLAM family member 7 isoform X5 n=1 Tax=Carlito syrichta TaxID=1868482 RepID=A0A3Q0DW21_CARSF|nr:SLAM family member 7 isoform X5 [Carlito syrichta]